jgi:integrase
MGNATRGKRGMGSIYKISQDGAVLFRASKSITVTDPVTGLKKRKRITGTGATAAIAISRMQDNLQERGGGLLPSPQEKNQEKHLFSVWFYEWLQGLPGERVSDIVKHNYRRRGELYLIPYIGSQAVEDLETEDLKYLFDFTLPDLKNSDGEQLLSVASRLNIYRVLQMCLTEATRRKKIGITISPLAGVKAPVRIKTRHSLGDKIGKTQGLIKYLKENNHPDYCRFLFQWLGLRRSERIGLSWSQVKNLGKSNPRIIINQQLARDQDGSGWYLKRPKTPESVREIPLVEPFLSALRDYKKMQDIYKQSSEWNPNEGFKDLVFLKPNGSLITQNQDNADWHTILTDYLGEDDPKWRGHLNRHITATLLAQNGVSAAIARRILGHSSEAMTYYYTAISTGSMAEPLAEYGQVLGKRLV